MIDRTGPFCDPVPWRSSFLWEADPCGNMKQSQTKKRKNRY
ncbi:hypothetical protein LptCag_2464 [Leptospirillum ferriphilum]|uniref:Uncharacterized protein n=1 Tax=Leptospirillum ferriphilum TaxID=178606 RepID=A0A094WES9_9BACT|nr:hypothetical protein LptCag_2464 [Leptospirillum ferriphilum]